jgi:uncharacterized protein
MMVAGHGLIVQAPLAAGRLQGRADLLLRVETASALGPFSYEPADIKLARETRAETILQLCAYAALIEPIQSMLPALLHVITPAQRE